jgi:anti-sigma factor RsiW
MNCRELKNLTPLHLSGELEASDRRRFDAHLAACPACAQEVERLACLDAQLVEALGTRLPDATRVEQAVRSRISAERLRRRWLLGGAIAAGIVAALAGAYGLVHLGPAPRMYADAARDHRAEVVDHQPRRWRSNPAEIQELTQPNGLSFAQAAALAPAGYALERAKNCGLDGQRMLHLIFRNGTSEFSVYLRPHRSLQEPVRLAQGNHEQVAGFETGRFRALVVTAGPELDCEHLAQLAKQRL